MTEGTSHGHPSADSGDRESIDELIEHASEEGDLAGNSDAADILAELADE